ncbi:MAG: DUF4363 family protein [Clostridia bacterium]|nr:DUF4363 family protein [Clostridia bacterium]
MKYMNVINFIIIALILTGICVVEEVLVSRSLIEIQNRCLQIESLAEEEGNIQNARIVLALDNLEFRWTEYESKLCYMVHHKNVQEIGQEIVKARKYIAENDVQEFEVSIELIKFYCHSYLHFMGASVHNVL